jgi:sigma-E factor negative regulatory protein RseB
VSLLTVRSVLLFTLGVLAVLLPGQPGVALQPDPEAGEDGPTWRDLLDRARSAGDGATYEGRLLVVSFDGGPTVGELDVAHAPDGTYVTDRSGSWVLSRDGEQTAFGDAATGTLLRIDGRARPTFSPGRLERNYDVRVAGHEPTSVGRAVVIEFSARGSAAVRERLHLHERSGLVIRRETFDRRGAPVRLATYTSLERGGETPEGRPGWVTEEVAPVAETVSYRGRNILREVGWWMERRLPGGFELVDSFALGDDGSAVHLLYSDGLYSLSIYQQVGRLDEEAVAARGAERTTLGGTSVHRIVGAEPATYMWSGDGRTFTAITDAPPDLVAEVAAALPADPPPTLLQRTRRTLVRAAEVLWPF